MAFLKDFCKLQSAMVLVAIAAYYYCPYLVKSANKPDEGEEAKAQSGVKLFTAAELSEYSGADGSKGLYIAILGSVYDVEKGRKHYGPGCSYNFFAGRDASTAFSTGEFEKVTDTLDDVLSLKPDEILGLENWKQFYDKDYIFKGYVIGRFYNSDGKENEYFDKVRGKLSEAHTAKLKREKDLENFPTCNVEWTEASGSRFWCTASSGGQERDWVGLPRKYFKAGEKSFRCACIQEDKLDLPNLKEFENCGPKSLSCFYEAEKVQ